MDTATAQQRLTEAEAALHSLQMGQVEEEIAGPDGRRGKYTMANADKLQRYVEWLRSQVAPRRPIVFRFGR
jgi:hypothetical protein